MENGECLYYEWENEFVPNIELTHSQKDDAQRKYKSNQTIFTKDWSELDEEAKQKWYKKYMLDNHIKKDGYKSYDEYFDDDYLEGYEEGYTTESGDEIVIFGLYGYDG